MRALWSGVLLLVGCSLTADYEGTSYLCPDGECPDGQVCVEGRCTAPEAVVDAAAACDDRFGTASGYELCLEEEETCRFFVSQTCDDICGAHGATCLSAQDAQMAAPCEDADVAPSCGYAFSQQVCTCTRDPGSSCDDQFGATKAYELCDEAQETCRFYNAAVTCSELCTASGSECLLTQDSDKPTQCTPETDQACNDEFGSQICTCRR